MSAPPDLRGALFAAGVYGLGVDPAPEAMGAVLECLRAMAGEPSTNGSDPSLVRLSAVRPERVRWLWPGRIPIGRLTLLDGDPGTGKSTVTMDLAARVTRGRNMPDGSPGLDAPRGVVLLTAEDGLADTVRPRLDAAGGDADRVVALRWVRAREAEDGTPGRRLPTVRDVSDIERAVREVSAAVVIVDPLSAYMGPADTHRDSDVRAALAGLAELAERLGVAVLAVRHLRKGGAGGNPLYAGGGSIAFVAAARSALLLARDPEDSTEERLVLAPLKSSLCRRPPSLACRVVETPDGTAVRWEGESAHTAARLLEREDGEQRSDRAGAMDWLRAALADGPRSAREVQREARSDGISDMTLRRARKALGVSVEQERSQDGRRVRGWVWRLGVQASEHLETEHLEDSILAVEETAHSAPLDAHVLTLSTLTPEDPPRTTCNCGCGRSVGRPGIMHFDCQRAGCYVEEQHTADCALGAEPRGARCTCAPTEVPRRAPTCGGAL
jgi:hypothetical protein